MSAPIYYGKHFIDESDIEAVAEVLRSGLLTQGPKVKEFENSLCNLLSSPFCTAVSNGTAALHLLGLALGWKKESIVITSPITFAASANCILYSGAMPDFCDINEISYTIDPDKLEHKIKNYRYAGKNVDAVVAVDYAGYPCDWKSLRYLADKYSFKLINDNCHALGAEYLEDPGYAVKYADAAVQSFHPVKHITTGEGGAILTNNPDLDRSVKLLRSHGITKDPKEMTDNPGFWYYEMVELGFNYRISDIQCALGISQLNKLPLFLKRRRAIAEFYDNFFSGSSVFIKPEVPADIKHAYHLYPLQIDFQKLKLTKKELFERLAIENIFLQVHYIPVHLHPYYRKYFGFKEGDFPAAEEFYSREISLPVYFSLTDDEASFTAEKIKGLCL